MKKIFVLIISIILLIIIKTIIHRQYFYIDTNYPEKDCSEIINNLSIKQFYINNTLTWYIPKEFKDKIIVFLHGNSFNITWKSKILNQLSNYFTCPIICPDYLRCKNTSVEKMIDTTSELIKYLFENGYNEDTIILFGESFGCSISLEIASRYKIKNVICYIGFRKMSDMIKILLPYFGNFVALFTSEFNNQKIIETEKLNVTLLNSPDDNLVNYSQVKQMSQETGTELLEISGSHLYPIIPYNVFLRLKEKYQI
jgi:surfactin synthase thioesterase subunit